MSQFNLHFGDLTARTVEWFLESLTEGGWTPSEELCKELNVVRFIDCLRDQLEKENKFFEYIENIATGLLDDKSDKSWKNRPHFSILLFSIARNFLVNQSLESVKKTALYRVAEKIYEHFKTHPDSTESCSHVFKTGFQLAYFQESSDWHREYTTFKDSNYKKLSELRLHYYSVTNPADFSKKVVERCQSIGTIPSGFEEWDKEFHVLNPLLLELPIFVKSSDALKFANKFIQDLENKKQDVVSELSKEFRCLQWEILIRNLIEETPGKPSFYPITNKYKDSGMPEFPFLIKFIQDAREIERNFIPSHGEIPKKKHNSSTSIDRFLLENEDLERTVEDCRKSFYTLLPKIPNDYAFVHEDLVGSFVNMQPNASNASEQQTSDNSSSADSSSNAILIEDGELSFFSLLWFLRYSVAQGKPPKAWGLGPDKLEPDKELPVRFRPNDNKSPDDWWDTVKYYNMYEFAEESGWVIRLSESECIPTRRWRSLLAWLRRLNTDLKGFSPNEEPCKTLSHNNPVIQSLPVKRLKYEKEDQVSFIKKLRNYLASDELDNYLKNSDVFLPGFSIDCEDFAKALGCLIETLVSLMAMEKSASRGLEDVLLRCCRGFIPLEHLFRAYQPCQLHILLLALNWERSSENQQLTPTAISGTTIAGRVETERNPMVGSENYLKWVTPYWSLFSSLSSQFTLPNVKKESEQMGAQKQQRYFAHQTAGLLGTVWQDRERHDLDFPASQFALWLALIHTQEIWGGLELDTNVKIYDEDFPKWQNLDAEGIFDEIFKLGIRGGIIRAARPPKPSGLGLDDPKWQLTNYVANNFLEGRYEEIVSHVRKLLLPNLSKNGSLLDWVKTPGDVSLPDWVDTKAFAVCFYHGLRQSVYHALQTFVLVDKVHKVDNKPCLWIEADTQNVLIYNRGKVVKNRIYESTDRMFFDKFVQKATDFCNQEGIDKKFKIDGPEPARNMTNTWQLVIGKE